jgi:hypothetical protein
MKNSRLLLTPELSARIARETALGLSLTAAAQLCGVDRRTAHAWYAKGKSGDDSNDGIYIAFFEEVQRADAHREQRLLAVIDSACRPDAEGHVKNWQAAAWKLERLYPERWSRPAQRVIVEHDDDGIVVSKQAIIDMAMKAAKDAKR